MQHTKIVATIGPASSTRSLIREMARAGVSVFRLNFSHGTHEEHKERIELIRQVGKELRMPLAILADLQGPKIRTGMLEKGSVSLKRGRMLTLTTKRVKGNDRCIMVDYPDLPRAVKRGMVIMLSEGMIKLRVETTDHTAIHCRILGGGILGERKGVNVVGITRAQSLTSKDKRDLSFIGAHNIDYIALSFVRTPDDVRALQKIMHRKKITVPIIAKIEKPEALCYLKEIIAAVDGVMVARGDLGVEGTLEEVPVWQKRIIREANKQHRLVITATQMLESMIEAPRPTRAEVTDVANAIFDGTGAVMLSGETAMGKYPVPAVAMMRKIIRAAEKSSVSTYYNDSFSEDDSATYAIAHAAIDAAQEAAAKAIVVFTMSGYTARFISSRKPAVPIIAFTPYTHVYQRMSLYWGVMPRMTQWGRAVDAVVDKGIASLQRERIIQRRDKVIVVFGASSKAGGTDRMKIVHV